MKKIVLVAMMLLILTACNNPTTSTSTDHPKQEDTDVGLSNSSVEPIDIEDSVHYEYDYFTFEEAVIKYSTDVVIAQYINQKPFGKKLIEFEFSVQERIMGDAPERIFVYAEPSGDADIDVVGIERTVDYRKGYLTFDTETDYMLVLTKTGSPYSRTHEDGYLFIRDIVVNLIDPPKSTMYSEPLLQHTKDMDFSKNATRQEMVSYVGEIVKGYDPPRRDYIKSEETKDIVSGSSNIWVIEISNPLRLSDEVPETDWMDTDIYYCTVVEVLKGGIKAGEEVAVIFFADTVKSGETFVIAAEPLEEGSSWYQFTSKNSLFQKDQYDEIKSIIGDVKP